MYKFLSIHNIFSKLYNKSIFVRHISVPHASQCNIKNNNHKQKTTSCKNISNNYTTLMEEFDRLADETKTKNKSKFIPLFEKMNQSINGIDFLKRTLLSLQSRSLSKNEIQFLETH